MATNYYTQYQQQQPHAHHGQHRSRRGPRVSSQNTHRQQYKLQQQRSPKESPAQEQPQVEYLQRLEAAMSFDWEDDFEFCPFNLLTEDDLQSIHSSSASERGSMSSGSPDSSPLQHQVQPTPYFMLSNASNSFTSTTPTGFQQAQLMKLHQPMAQRSRNAIPIVDPASRSSASPPLSISPARQMQQQFVGRRGW